MKITMRTLTGAAVITLWIAITAFAWFAPKKETSLSERRPLQQMPEMNLSDLQSGSFMGQFETYTLDQFPLRDGFRSLKAIWSYGVLNNRDNNGLYTVDGYVAKLDYPLNTVSVQNATEKFSYLYETCLKDAASAVYMTIIPDKGYYLAAENGYPAMDYSSLFSQVAEQMPWATMVDITDRLDISHYYKTDSHWRQEKLIPVAEKLCAAMGAALPNTQVYAETLADSAFRGVYYGQSALPLASENLYIMRSRMLDACRVYNHETKTYTNIYDLQGLGGLDPYDVYLSGAQAHLTIENPNAKTGRELIVFRDSFGSSLVPLLVQGYDRITVVDIRYIRSDLLAEAIDFNGRDVLFAYSTSILNNSASLK